MVFENDLEKFPQVATRLNASIPFVCQNEWIEWSFNDALERLQR